MNYKHTYLPVLCVKYTQRAYRYFILQTHVSQLSACNTYNTVRQKEIDKK